MNFLLKRYTSVGEAVVNFCIRNSRNKLSTHNELQAPLREEWIKTSWWNVALGVGENFQFLWQIQLGQDLYIFGARIYFPLGWNGNAQTNPSDN